MSWVQLQQQPLDAGFLPGPVRAADRDDEASGAPGRQVIDPGDKLVTQRLIVAVEADERPPVANQRAEQILLGRGGGQALHQRWIGQQQPEPGPARCTSALVPCVVEYRM